MSETAYEIARRHGYRFSEEQWLKSLQGAGTPGTKGERGERGPRGLPGTDGKQGRDGQDGRDGIDGKNGLNGRDGAMPDPVPWTATIERDPQTKLAKAARILSSEGDRWEAQIVRAHPSAPFDEVRFVPLTT